MSYRLVEFARPKGAKDKKPRKKRGALGSAKDLANSEVERFQKRRKEKDTILENDSRKAKNELDEAKRKALLKKVKLGLAAAGTIGTGAASVLAAKKGYSAGKAARAVTEKAKSTVKKGIKTGGEAVGVGIAKGSKAVGKKVADSGKKVVDDTVKSVKDTGKKVADSTKKAANEAKDATATQVKKVPGAKRTVNNGKATRKAFDEGLNAPGPGNEKVNALARKAGKLRARMEPGASKRAASKAAKSQKKANKKSRKELEKKKPSKRTGRVGGSLFSRRVKTIEFAKKKAVKVKGYVRSDGVKVRPSTREVLDTPPPDGAERIARISLAARPLAESLSIAAGAYATLLGAQDSRRKTNRELSGLGETRKFLGLAGTVGTGFGSSARGFNSLRGFKSDLKLRQRQVDLKALRTRAINKKESMMGGQLADKLSVQRESLEIRRKQLDNKDRTTGIYDRDVSVRESKESRLSKKGKRKS